MHRYAKEQIDVDTYTPDAEGIAAMHEMVLAVAKRVPSAHSVPDATGASPIHALCISNHEASLALMFAIIAGNPRILTSVHSSDGPYTGESCLHILIVNRRESALIDLLSLASQKLSRDELCSLLRSQARGKFFEAVPMRRFGGTPLAYACAFSLRRAIAALLETGLVSLNDINDRCSASGFLPLHAVVASNNTAMFDHLTSELRPDMRAQTRALTSIGYLERRGIVRRQAGLTPVQLAAQLGLHQMVRHILHKQCDVLWVWGPVTNHALDLSGVDSSMAGGGDIMDLIVRDDASLRTTELLLDDFMNGFLYRLYMVKWHLYARRLHYLRLLLDGTLVLSLAIQSFWLKTEPSQAFESSTLIAQNWLHVLLIGIAIVLEIFMVVLSARNERRQLDEQSGWRSASHQARRFFVQHGVHVLFASHFFTLFGCALLGIPGALPHPACAPAPVTGWYQTWIDEQEAKANITHMCAGRRLRGAGGGGSGGGSDSSASFSGESDGALYVTWEITDEGRWALLWISQAAALALLVFHLATAVATQFENLHITLCLLRKMFLRDFLSYLSAFSFIFAAFYLALFIVYPRSGSHVLPHSRDFNSAHRSFFALLDMAFLAEKVDFDVLPAGWNAIGIEQKVGFALWILLYYLFLVVSCILMLNFLIAQMSHTIDGVLAAATLQSRLGFATHVMKLELLASFIGMETRVGERTDFGTYIFTFKSYAHGVNEGDDETGSADNLDVLDMDHSDMGIGDPFAPPHAVHADASLEMRRMHRLLQRMETRSSINGIANAAIKWSLSTRK